MPEPPRGPGGPTHLPPTTFEKTLFDLVGAKIDIHGARIQIYGQDSNIHSAKTQICCAKIKKIDPKFK